MPRWKGRPAARQELHVGLQIVCYDRQRLSENISCLVEIPLNLT